MKKRKPNKKPLRQHSQVIQKHHITYNPDWVVPVYKGEHYILCLLQARFQHNDRISIGFLTALHHWIESMKEGAVEL